MHNAALVQGDALNEGGVWPMRVQLVMVAQDGTASRMPVLLDAARAALPELNGKLAPRYAYANDGDFGYGLFLLDAASRTYLLANIARVEGSFLRALLWDALWESVREAELPPLDYLDAVIRELPPEDDEVTAGTLLSRLQMVFRWYLSDAQQSEAASRLEQALAQMMEHGRSVGLRILSFRAYAAIAWSAQARARLKQLFTGELTVPGVALSSNDRFRIVRRLLVLGDADGPRLLAEQSAADVSDEGRRQAYAARAATPDVRVKQALFAAYVSDQSLPERWIEESLPAFNAVEHEQLTVALLAPALRALPELKGRHKIFFVNDWLAAFVGGQRSAQALDTVHRALREQGTPPDLRRKLLETVDDLERTVKIRARYALQ